MGEFLSLRDSHLGLVPVRAEGVGVEEELTYVVTSLPPSASSRCSPRCGGGCSGRFPLHPTAKHIPVRRNEKCSGCIHQQSQLNVTSKRVHSESHRQNDRK